MKLIKTVVDNIYFNFGDICCKQNIGLPMGTDCAPQLANLILHYLEYTFIIGLIRKNEINLARKFTYTYRYIDDITILNGNGGLDLYYKDIYPDCLKLEKINNNKRNADVLDLNIFQHNGKFITKTFDKRRNFNFDIICFPNYFSNIPIQLGYNVYKAQVVRHAENNGNIQFFKINIYAYYFTIND